MFLSDSYKFAELCDSADLPNQTRLEGGDTGTYIRSCGGLLHQPPYEDPAHLIALATQEHYLDRVHASFRIHLIRIHQLDF